jgi:hypothetical protein
MSSPRPPKNNILKISVDITNNRNTFLIYLLLSLIKKVAKIDSIRIIGKPSIGANIKNGPKQEHRIPELKININFL